MDQGRKYLGSFAPKFAELNDDVLFGQVWTRQGQLSLKLRSLITISALIGAGVTDQSLKSHLEIGKQNGITKGEIVEAITHLAFYTGWPKAWAVFSLAKDVYSSDKEEVPSLFDKGELIENKHFNGKVYIKEIYGFDKPVLIDNVTFEPGCRNSWHAHQIGQTLLVTDGKGWYQEEGKPARELHPGDIVQIPPKVKHWHGASLNSYFSHIAIEDSSKGAPIWYEKVSDEDYMRTNKGE